jgi:3-dehydroquinate synthase
VQIVVDADSKMLSVQGTAVHVKLNECPEQLLDVARLQEIVEWHSRTTGYPVSISEYVDDSAVASECTDSDEELVDTADVFDSQVCHTHTHTPVSVLPPSVVAYNTMANMISSTTVCVFLLQSPTCSCSASAPPIRPPLVGFGSFDTTNDDRSGAAVAAAVRAGYRHFDLASVHGNLDEVGNALRAAISANVVTRDELYLTFKLWCTEMAPDDVIPAVQVALRTLGFEYVDNLMIHWPCQLVKGNAHSDEFELVHTNDPALLLETWRAMEHVHAAGLCRTLGVANCNVMLLRAILEGARIAPVANIVECHPYLAESELLNFCQSVNIALIANMPLEPVEGGGPSLVDDEEISAIAREATKSPAQVVLRWAVQHGLGVIASSHAEESIGANQAVLDWQLTTKQMARLDALDRSHRFEQPAFYDFGALPRGHIRNRAQPVDKPGHFDEAGRYWNEFSRPGKELRTQIVIGQGILRDLEASAAAILPETALTAKNYLVTDSVVDSLYGDLVMDGLKAAGVRCQKIVIPADQMDEAGESSAEPSKTRAVYNGICDTILENGLTKHTCVISLGGGVVNNLCGTIASALYRGISLVHITTSTMGMVDASIDFKQAMNHRCGKNLLGAYYPASVIVMDPEVVVTQSKRHVLNGIAESLKHGFCQSRALCDDIVDPLAECSDDTAVHDTDFIERIAKHTMEVKCPTLDCYHDSDFNEMIPQYGHAVAHAVEHLSWSGAPHSALLHGEAVAIGMCVTAEIAFILGKCDMACVDDHYSYVGRAGLPTGVPSTMEVDAILQALKYDKHFVEMPSMGLCSKIGEMAMASAESYTFNVPMDIVAQAIAANTKRVAADTTSN